MRYKKQKGIFGKFILAYSLLFVSIFTVVVLIIFAYTGYEPSALVQWVYTFWGLEISALMVKKVADIKTESKRKEGIKKNEDNR